MALLMNEEHEFLFDYSDVGIPKTVTLSSYSTGMEQLRLSSDNLTNVMIKDILPQVIDPKIDVRKLMEPDYYLLLRHLRILTWGPFYTIGSFFCKDCLNESGNKGKLHEGKKQINLGTIGVLCPEKPEDLTTTWKISRDEFVFLEADVTIHMNRCADLTLINSTKVKTDADKALIPVAASIQSVTGEEFVEIHEALDWLKSLAPVDCQIIRDAYAEHFNIGLQNRVEFECPVCGGAAWSYVPINDNYFRPTKEDIKEWKRLLADSKEQVRPGKQ